MVEGKINWKLLYEAIEFYNKNGYEYIDLDWCVSEEASNITKPFDKRAFFIDDKELVASGEQSFLDMILRDELPYGKYCGITPCFRDEERLDDIHQKYFMKVELIDTENCNKAGLDNIMNIAMEFYKKHLNIELLKIDDFMYDIIDSKNKIELGSYGCRFYTNYDEEFSIEWTYGTGLAEPRLSKVLMLQ